MGGSGGGSSGNGRASRGAVGAAPAADAAAKESWWKTLPGILTSLAALITAVTALIAGLKQIGVFDAKDAVSGAAPASSATTRIEPPAAASAAAPPAAVAAASAPQAAASVEPAASTAVQPQAAAAPADPTGGTDKAPGQRLWAALQRHNVTTSVGAATLVRWIDDPYNHYRLVAEGCLRLLQGRRLRGEGADLDKINALYLRALKLTVDDTLPADHRIDRRHLAQAIVDAYVDKTGSPVADLAAATRPL